jgi:hypothetical protein
MYVFKGVMEETLSERMRVRVFPCMLKAIKVAMDENPAWWTNSSDFVRMCINYTLKNKYGIVMQVVYDDKDKSHWEIVKTKGDKDAIQKE